MKPTVGQARVDKILTQFSQMYRNDSYISERIMLPVKVKEKTGKFAKYGKENLRTYSEQTIRAPGTRAHTVDYSVSQGSYICQERSLEKLVPDEMVNNTDDPYDAKRDATAVLMDNIWVNQELALSTAMGNTAIITQNVTLTGTDKWSDVVNSDPFGDIETAITTVRTAVAKRPNVMVLSHNVFLKLKSHPDVREQVKYTNGGQLSDDAFIAFLKGFFRLEEVLVGEAVYNSAEEGQTDSLSDVWSGNAWLLYRASRPSLMNASFGYTIFDVPRQTDVYREEPKISDVVRQRYSFDQTICDAACCYLIKGAV